MLNPNGNTCVPCYWVNRELAASASPEAHKTTDRNLPNFLKSFTFSIKYNKQLANGRRRLSLKTKCNLTLHRTGRHRPVSRYPIHRFSSFPICCDSEVLVRQVSFIFSIGFACFPILIIQFVYCILEYLNSPQSVVVSLGLRFPLCQFRS